MKRAGFEPCVVVETSPGNFQAWVNHGRVLPKVESTAAARELAERLGMSALVEVHDGAELAAALGGRAWVEDGDGRGARFVVELPRAEAGSVQAD